MELQWRGAVEVELNQRSIFRNWKLDLKGPKNLWHQVVSIEKTAATWRRSLTAGQPTIWWIRARRSERVASDLDVSQRRSF
jgi:hypothetical protein